MSSGDYWRIAFFWGVGVKKNKKQSVSTDNNLIIFLILQ